LKLIPVMKKGTPAELDEFATRERVELYYAAHPNSPSAVRRPQITKRRATWVVLLGPNMHEGIVGLGKTVEQALHAFDEQYLARLRPMAA
jgi:hypothetical protein